MIFNQAVIYYVLFPDILFFHHQANDVDFLVFLYVQNTQSFVLIYLNYSI